MKKGGKVVTRNHTAEQLMEWKLLFTEAKKIGLTVDEIREFFFQSSQQKPKKQ